MARLAGWELRRHEHTATGITGVVVDPEGQPIEGAQIVARRDDAAAFALAGQASASSGADGSYSIEGLEPGAYRLTAVASGYSPTELYPVTVGGDRSQRADLELQRGKPIRGQLLDPAGQPVSGALVMFSLTGKQMGAGTPGESDINGWLEVMGPADGPVDVTVLSQAWAPKRLVGAVPGDEPMVITMSAGGSIRIQAVDPDGSPLAGLTVAPVSTDDTMAGLAWFTGPAGVAVTDVQGSAEFLRLAPGQYRIETPGRDDIQPTILTVVEGQETAAQVRVP